MTKDADPLELLRQLFALQRSAALATTEAGRPYLSLMAFVASEDLQYMVIATYRNTRKYRNMQTDPRVALLVDNRANLPSDPQQAIAVTALGQAEEVGAAEKRRFLTLYLTRHPDLETFATSPDCALIKVKVDRYYVVSNFQEVREVTPR